jgi:hypothetical protein
MFDTKKLVAALKARVAALETQATKDAQTVADRFKIIEENVFSTVKTDAPEVLDQVSKLTADLASAVARIEALEAEVKANGLKEAATAAGDLAKAVKASKKATATPAAPVVEETAPATEAVTA